MVCVGPDRDRERVFSDVALCDSESEMLREGDCEIANVSENVALCEIVGVIESSREGECDGVRLEKVELSVEDLDQVQSAA